MNLKVNCDCYAKRDTIQTLAISWFKGLIKQSCQETLRYEHLINRINDDFTHGMRPLGAAELTSTSSIYIFRI